MSEFKLFSPETLEDGLVFLDKFCPHAVLLSGGTDLVPLLKKKIVKPKYVLALNRIHQLDQLCETEDGLLVGALTTHEKVHQSDLLQTYASALVEASGSVGSLQTRNLGTLAGNLANASPSADSAPALLVLNAELLITSLRAEAVIPLTSFFKGPKHNCLASDQMIKEIRFRKLRAREGSAFLKLGRRCAVTMAVASAAAYVRLDRKRDRVEELRLAFGSVAPTPIRAFNTEKKASGLNQAEVCELVRSEVSKEIDPISDMRATKEYREKVAPILAARAVENAIYRAIAH